MRARILGTIEDCMPVISLSFVVGVVTLIAWQVTRAISESRGVHVLQESVIAAVAADAAALEFLGVRAPESASDADSAPELRIRQGEFLGLGVTVRSTQKAGAASSQFRIDVDAARGRKHRFECPILAGSAPSFLARPLSVGGPWLRRHSDSASWLEQSLPPRRRKSGVFSLGRFDLDRHLGATVRAGIANVHTDLARSRLLHWVTPDASIAVRRLPSGSDGEDFVLTAATGSRAPRPVADGLVVIPGNLWLDRGERAHVLELADHLTLVVEGNIYLGRSLSVIGPGRLILIAHGRTDGSFRDRDGDGRWSPGDQPFAGTAADYRGRIEGAGLVYLGLPGVAQERVEINASLVTGNEVHARAGSVVVHGALVAGQGVARWDEAHLSCTGASLANIHRGRVPGFRRRGRLRPGLLRPVDGVR